MAAGLPKEKKGSYLLLGPAAFYYAEASRVIACK
jgi:hypothetical protein